MLVVCEQKCVCVCVCAETRVHAWVKKHLSRRRACSKPRTLVVQMSQLLPMVRLHGLPIVAQLLVSVLHEQRGGGGLDRAVVFEVEVNLLDTREHPRLVPYEGGDPSLPRRHYSQLPELRLDRRV